MARQRDYKAEERRRNELARQRGFTSRAAERGSKTRADYERAGYASHTEYTEARKRSRERSNAYSRTPASAFFPTMTPEQFRSHANAYDKTHETRDDFLKALAADKHRQNPDEFPEWLGHEDFWRKY